MRSAPCAWASPSAAMDRLSTPGSACAQAGVGPKCSSVKSGPSARSSQAVPSVPGRRMGASASTAPGICVPSKVSVSGVLSAEPCSVAGTDSRPLLTMRRANSWSRARSSTASRNRRLISLLGVMKSVARVELRMFSSAAYSRSAP